MDGQAHRRADGQRPGLRDALWLLAGDRQSPEEQERVRGTGWPGARQTGYSKMKSRQCRPGRIDLQGKEHLRGKSLT